MNITSYNRYQAFAVHLAVSFVIFLVLLLLVFYVWYPGIFFESEKGWKAIALIAGVDLVLGPLCTLIVFNPAKKSLKMDLAIIALLQAGALIAGSYLIHERRPVGFLMFQPVNGVMTLYAANLNSQAISYIAEQSQPLFKYQQSEPPSRADNPQAQAVAIKKENLNLLSFESLQHISTTQLSQHQIRLQIDKGLKNAVYLVIDKNGDWHVESHEAEPVQE